MNRKRLLAAILCLFVLQSYLNAQEKSKVQFGKVSPGDFILPTSSIIDSNTNAVILSDKGTTHFVGNRYWFSYVFKKEKRVKIINKKAFEAATEEFALYGSADEADKMDNLSASTYNLENGKVVETKLDKKEVFEETLSKTIRLKKFTMPAVKEGSIIEFTYTITSPDDRSMPAWFFQSQNYPCLWSEYEVIIPQTLSYVFIRQGVHEYCLDKGSEGREFYKLKEKVGDGALADVDKDLMITAQTIKHNWAMKNIPAFYVENYISAPQNYLDKIEFQLSQRSNGQGDSWDHTNSWKKATEELLAEEDFGLPLLGDMDWLSPVTDKIGVDNLEPVDQAKMIYYYVTNNFTCTNHNYRYIKTTLQDVVKKKNGTVGDLNLLLIAMLRKKGFTADPVLLSTREHGFNLANYPIMERLNYVIARVGIGDKIYYLDASHPQLGFGQLPGNCYNGHARIISSTDSGSVYFYADSLKEKKTTIVFLTNNDKGEIEGTYQSTLGAQESYNTRVELGSTKQKEYFKNIQTSYGEDLDISNPFIDSLDKPEMPVKINYEFRLKQPSDAAMIYFNPLFGEAYRHNPFTAAERKYPVEMPYAFDDVYIFNMEIPAGYAVEELPKSTRVAFNGKEGLFEYLAGAEGNSIQLRVRVKLDRAYFAPEDYSNLRDFFAYIVKKESEQIVLKKK